MAPVQRLRLATLLPIVLSAALAGCAGEAVEDDVEGTTAAASERRLDAAECAQVTLLNESTSPGTFQGPMKGCVLAPAGRTGADLVLRASAIVVDTRELAGITKPTGEKIFSGFQPSALAGALDAPSGVTFTAKVGIDVTGPFDAKGTLAFTARREPAGELSFVIVNATPITAAGATIIAKDALRIEIRLSPVANGVVVTGSAKVKLEKFEGAAGKVSALGPQIVGWLDRKLGAAQSAR